MQPCPNCQHPNPPEAAFCMGCGTKLTRACTNCGANLPAAARFCMNCGQPVAASTPIDEARRARLVASTPNLLAEKMRAAHVAGERKVVTVLFADVVGSTALAEQMDPEDWTTIMNRAFERLSPAIHRYEGTIARLMGDALLAFFGAPVAHEDDPVRAVRAALDLLAAAGEYATEARRAHGIEFALRVGLNTGTVVVGAVGSDLKYEYTAMGDAVNLAARMQTAADPGTVLITENTYRLAAPFFEFEDRGRILVKGKSEPVQTYRVIGQSRGGVVQARGIEGLSSPLVGRDAEMHTLREAIVELRRGNGQIVSVMGEAGLGKSRLVAELRASPTSLAKEKANLYWLEGRSLSYETATLYAPFVDMFSGYFQMQTLRDDAEKYVRIRTAIAEIVPDRASDIAPFIASLLEVKLTGEDAERVRYLEPPQLRGRVFKAVCDLIEQLATTHPLVLVFEDLHWADPTSLDLIEQLMPLTHRVMLMILALFRPRRDEPSWRFHETATREYAHRYTPIALRPLDEDQSRELVANLLEIEDLPEKVRVLILSKAEGNPFFVEEVIRSLLDAGWVVRDDERWRATREIEKIAVPDTLVGVITARLDRLDDDAKRTAQIASVIGREFLFDVLAEITEARPTLDASLGTLQRRELIRERSRMPKQTYLFKHVLTQETAYVSILLSRRRDLHRRVAECLEQTAPDEINEIARHLLEAREQARALPYLVEAADRAAHAYSTPVATALYTQALEILKTVESPQLARRAYEGKGNALILANDLTGAAENYRAMLQYSEAHTDIPMQVSALNKLARTAMFLGRLDESDQHLLRAEELARRCEDQVGLAEMFTVRCNACNMVGDFGGAAHYMGEATQLGRLLNVKEQMAYGLTHMAGTLTNMTRFEEAWATAQEALQVVEEIGHLQHKTELLMSPIPFYYLRSGDLDAARAAAEEGLSLAHRIGYTLGESFSAYILGLIAHWHGEYERAIASYKRSLQAGRLTGMAMWEVFASGALGAVYQDISERLSEQTDEYHAQALRLLDTPMGMPAGGMAWADLGFCLLRRGNVALAVEMLQKGLTTPTIPGLLNRPRFLIGLAYVALAQNDLGEAARRVDQARAYVEERAMKHLYPEVAFAEAKVSEARGEHERALEQCAQVEAAAQDMTMRPIAWQVRVEAANVLTRLGRAAEAEAKRREACVIVDEIAGLFTDETLRAMFVQSAKEKIDLQ